MIALDSIKSGSTKTYRAPSIYRLLSTAVLRSTTESKDGELRSLVGFTGDYTTVQLADSVDSIVKIPFILGLNSCHILTKRPREIAQAMDRLLVDIAGNYGWVRTLVKVASRADDADLLHDYSESIGRPHECVIVLLNDDPKIESGIRPMNLNREVPLVVIDKDYDSENLLQYFNDDSVKIGIV